MDTPRFNPSAGLLDERSPTDFRTLFGEMLRRSQSLDTAILRIRLGAVDLSAEEVTPLRRIRVLVAEVSARTLEEEAYALLVDPEKRENLKRVLGLLQQGVLEIRSAPLGGWSPDFSVFTADGGPSAVLVGLHWFQKPFPHRGPAWAAWFGREEALVAARRFAGIWGEAHDIGPAIRRLLERASRRREGSWIGRHPPARPGNQDPLSITWPDIITHPKDPAGQRDTVEGKVGGSVDTASDSG